MGLTENCFLGKEWGILELVEKIETRTAAEKLFFSSAISKNIKKQNGKEVRI